MKKYYPIFVSKSGEFTALKKLSQQVKDGISPIIEVISNNYDRVLNFATNEWNFIDNELYLDFSLCFPYDDNETKKLIEELISNQINVIPVLDKNSHLNYLTYIKTLFSHSKINKICFRLNNGEIPSSTIEHEIDLFLNKIGTNRKSLSLLVDFGIVGQHNYLTCAKECISIIESFKQNDLNSIIVSCGSFPQNLSSFTPPNRLYTIKRYEWLFWLELQKHTDIRKLISYSDFGTKYPTYTEASFPGTCSIKYSTELEFLIYRGELSKLHRLGNGQFIGFASQLILNQNYYGRNFSWGDDRIFTIASQLNSLNQTPGNLETWVQISQNHHITLIHNLL
ncbi:beta family protein [Sphingobacterium siyangense]|uniref:beta family protein n=1 Tax=Sphingobacterium siyangense TaxID=459529 RepID=UPI003DA63955